MEKIRNIGIFSYFPTKRKYHLIIFETQNMLSLGNQNTDLISWPHVISQVTWKLDQVTQYRHTNEQMLNTQWAAKTEMINGIKKHQRWQAFSLLSAA